MSVKGLRRIYQPALNPDMGKATNIKVDIQTKSKDDNIHKDQKTKNHRILQTDIVS